MKQKEYGIFLLDQKTMRYNPWSVNFNAIDGVFVHHSAEYNVIEAIYRFSREGNAWCGATRERIFADVPDRGTAFNLAIQKLSRDGMITIKGQWGWLSYFIKWKQVIRPTPKLVVELKRQKDIADARARQQQQW